LVFGINRRPSPRKHQRKKSLSVNMSQPFNVPKARDLGSQVEEKVPFGTSDLALSETSPLPQTGPRATSLNEDERRNLLKGKRVVVTGAGHPEKQFILDRILELGCKVVLVDVADSYAKHLAIERFVPVNFNNPDTAVNEAVTKLKLVQQELGEFDGIFNFWEDYVGYCGAIGTALGLRCNTEESAITARSKNRTREAMRRAGLPTPVSILCKTRQDLEAALPKVPFPAVVKPVFGASALGAIKVLSADDARDAFERNQQLLTPGTFYCWKLMV
jgi:hypothetical protein